MKVEKELREIALQVRQISMSPMVPASEARHLVGLYKRLFACVDELNEKARNRRRKPNIGPGAVKRAEAALRKASSARL
jgi:hypothetical protein